MTLVTRMRGRSPSRIRGSPRSRRSGRSGRSGSARSRERPAGDDDGDPRDDEIIPRLRPGPLPRRGPGIGAPTVLDPVTGEVYASAEVLVDPLTGAVHPRHPGRRAPRGRPGRGATALHVTVPAETLLGISEAPGELTGYGPIPASMARRLAPGSIMRRLLTDPVSGTLLDYGTTHLRRAGRPGRARAWPGTGPAGPPAAGAPPPAATSTTPCPTPRAPPARATSAAVCRHHHLFIDRRAVDRGTTPDGVVHLPHRHRTTTHRPPRRPPRSHPPHAPAEDKTNEGEQGPDPGEQGPDVGEHGPDAGEQGPDAGERCPDAA